MPLCHRPVIRGKDGVGLGICSLCALEISDWLIDLQNKPAMTERQLQRHYRDLKAQEDQRSELERRAMNPGWIYYIQIDDRIKIGFSLDVKSRMRAYPPNAHLLAVHPGTKKLEREMHEQFRSALAAGREWFHRAPEVLEHIEQVVAQFGPPETKHIHKYREGQQQTIQLHRRSHRGSNRRPR